MRRFLRNPGDEGGGGSRSSPVFIPMEENGFPLGGKGSSTKLNRVSMNRRCCYPIHVPRVFLPSTPKSCLGLQQQPNLFCRLPKLGPIPSSNDGLPHLLQPTDEYCSRDADIGPRAESGAFIDKSGFKSIFNEGRGHSELYPSFSRISSSEIQQRPGTSIAERNAREALLPRPPSSECRPPSCIQLLYARKFRAGTAVPEFETCLPSPAMSPVPGLLVAQSNNNETPSALTTDSKCDFGDCISFAEAKCSKRACAFEIPFNDTDEESKRSSSTQSYLSRDPRSSRTATVRFDQRGDIRVQDNSLGSSKRSSFPKSVAFEVAFTPVPPKTPKSESTRYRKFIPRVKNLMKTYQEGRYEKSRSVSNQHDDADVSEIINPLNYSKPRLPEQARARANVIEVPVRKKQLDRVTIDALKRIREYRHKPVKNVVRRRGREAYNAEVLRNSSKQRSTKAPSNFVKENRISRNKSSDIVPVLDRSRIPVLISSYYGNLPQSRSRVIKGTSRRLNSETTACVYQSRIPRRVEPVTSLSHDSSKWPKPLTPTPVPQSSLTIDKIEIEGRGNTADDAASDHRRVRTLTRAGTFALEEQLQAALSHVHPSQELRLSHIDKSDERPPASTWLLYPYQNLVKSTLTADEARKMSRGVFGISTEQDQGRFSLPRKFGKAIYCDRSGHYECPATRKLTPYVKNRGGWRNSSANGNSNI